MFSDYTKELSQNCYTWLITGVAGFIGSNLLETLLNLNQRVVGLDNFCTGKLQNIQLALKRVPVETHRHFVLHTGDIRSLEECEKAMGGIDFVLHQAALPSVAKSIKNPTLTHEINVNGFFNIMTAAQKANVKRCVYASSCAIYGNTNTLPHNELQSVHILSPYGASKFINEIDAATFSSCYGLENIGLRYFNVFGPRQDVSGPYAAVISRWVDQLLKNEQTYIHENPGQSRDFCYVEDVVAANIISALTPNKDAINTVYNIGTGQESNLRHIYNTILEVLNIKYAKQISQESEPGEITHSYADITKARQLLGYNPQCTVKEGIQRLVASLGLR